VFALTYPETVEEFPWGHRAMKVEKKTFLFLALEGDELSLSVKLPKSNLVALLFPYASPTDYGLGQSGWITARFKGRDKVDIALLKEWVDESYRAIAPKRFVALLDGGELGREGPGRKRPKKRK
jgi:predicted DNA-binding protein (MmcQ/YjbR family)